MPALTPIAREGYILAPVIDEYAYPCPPKRHAAIR